jgi:Tol biopolymer transport system component
MSLSSGTCLGPYEIVAAVGAGGMGEVYRARDTRLKRDVALKILPESFASDADRLARFQREAEVLASLNHPNIAAIHGLEESDGVRALVMELVDGETLADRIARGPIPIDEALPIAKQIAEALEAAHEQGIIHRDLKPANIKVTPNGVVKVLDFGLAKLSESAGGQPSVGGPVSLSPTITSPALMTGVGVLLGTAAYMSPEQARGKAADKRSDIWAFGCVLYEMLTSKRTFSSDEIADTLAFVVTKDPDWSALPAATPSSIRKLLRRCLEKDRKRRLPDAGSARLELEDALSAPPDQSAAPGARRLQPEISAWRRSLPWASAVVALVIGGAAVWVSAPWRTPAPPALRRLSVELGADVSLLTDQGAAAVLSPDGQTLAFVAQPSGATLSQLYVRRLAELQPKALNGAEGARDPFFSPDGQWIGFFAGGKLKKISVGGGSAVTLADAPNSRGAAWTDDDSIVFQPINAQTLGSRSGSLMRIRASGGMPQQLTTLVGDEVTHRWPQMLPGGKAVLFTAHNTTTAGYEDANIIVQSLIDGSRKTVVRGGYFARYAPSGHLVYLHEGTVFAAPFDIESFTLKGQPTPVLDGVTTNAGFGGAQFAFSSTGSLVYVQGSRFDLNAPILWMNRKGSTSVLRSTRAVWSNPQFSPDGRFLAIDINGAAGAVGDIWIYDPGRDALSRLTFGATNQRAVWTPDGRHIAFSSRRGDGSIYNIYWQPADGTGDVQRLTESKYSQLPASWHPSGKFLAFTEGIIPGKSNDLMILPMEGNEASGWKPGRPYVFLSTPLNESEPVFSPDGRWVAYASNESSLQANDVYVRPFPGPGGKWQISTDGGNQPAWSRSGRELFYRTPEGRLMVVSYTVEGDSFRADKPQAVAETRTNNTIRGRAYALHPDSQRFAVAATPQDTGAKQDKVVFVFNFFDELRRLAPAAK